MTMIKTEIHLTRLQRNELTAIAEAEGKSQSQLIRLAMDRFIDQQRDGCEEVLDRAAGIWAGRADIPELCSLRETWDRQ